MNVRTWIAGLLGCSIVAVLVLAAGSFDSSTAAIAAEPPDDETNVDRDGDAERGQPADLKGPCRKTPPPEVDDEDDEGDENGGEPRKMRPRGRRGEPGRRGEDRRHPRRGERGKPSDGDGPPHRGRGLGRDFPHPRFELTDEVIDRVMAFLKDKLQDWHERLVRLRDENPKAFRGALRRVIPLVEEYNHLQEANPELAEKVLEEFRIEHKLRKLARQYIEAEGDAEAREKIEAQIEPLVREQLKIRLLRHEAKLDKMQERIAQGRKKLEEERANLDKAVANRVKQIKKGKFRERGREKFRRDRKERRGMRDGPRHRGPRGDDEPDRPRRRGPPREPEEDL